MICNLAAQCTTNPSTKQILWHI